MKLPLDIFQTILQNTPLISIDFIIKNERDEVLLGKRANKPAKGYWFVPGGRIFKNETIFQAFKRIATIELGADNSLSLCDAQFLGVFEHFYNDSIFDDNITTQYIVLGYELVRRVNTINLPLIQHEDYIWIGIDDLLEHKNVHPYTKAYFK